MAEISKIKTTDNSVYDIKVFTDHVYPFLSKTYTSTSYYATNANQAKSTFYCMKIRPDAYNIPWMVKFKVHTFCPSYTNYNSITYSTFMGRQNGITYANFNEMDSTGHYYITFYPLLTAGYNAGYSHAVGISLLYAGNYTSANYYRTFEISVYSIENCTIELLDTPVLWENWTGGNTTNYGTLVNTNAYSRGLQETGDVNDVNYYNRIYYTREWKTYTNLYRYLLLLQKDEHYLLPVNAVNNTTATTKTLTTETFNPFGEIFFFNNTTTFAANAEINSNGNLYNQFHFDLRYSFNTGSTLTAFGNIFLVAVPQGNGLAKLADIPIVQALPNTEDGKLYIFLGKAYNTYQIEFYPNHPIYWYKDGQIRLYTPNDAYADRANYWRYNSSNDTIELVFPN